RRAAAHAPGICGLPCFSRTGALCIGCAQELCHHKIRLVFLLFGLGVFIVCMVVGCSRYGKIRLGGEGEPPAYSFYSWLAMIFFSAIGSSAILWSVCEPLNYIASPPFGYEPYSLEAFNIAIPYGLFHWGPVAWSFYALSGLVVSYYFLVLKRRNLKISGVMTDLIGEKAAKGVPGKAIDIVTI
ncbi:BCCT family transporter, partial [Lacticaseibacillus rhamnosus]|uniref:BCCT family transporter n=1 Tax=Lacticaseibacillus rhamnosus TaxID=47715 RepID=UPI0015D768BD